MYYIIDLDFGAHLGSPKFQRVTLRVYAEGEDEKMQDEEGVQEVEALQQKQPQNKKTSKLRTFLNEADRLHGSNMRREHT